MPLYFWEEEKKLQRRHTYAGQEDRSMKLVDEYDPKNFLSEVPETDSSGFELPPWKRQIIAKQLAEKAYMEAEEKKKIDEHESRFKDMPAWKRALLEKKGDTEKVGSSSGSKKEKRPAPPPPTHDEDGLPLSPWQVEFQQRRTRATIERMEQEEKDLQKMMEMPNEKS